MKSVNLVGQKEKKEQTCVENVMDHKMTDRWLGSSGISLILQKDLPSGSILTTMHEQVVLHKIYCVAKKAALMSQLCITKTLFTASQSSGVSLLFKFSLEHPLGNSLK